MRSILRTLTPLLLLPALVVIDASRSDPAEAKERPMSTVKVAAVNVREGSLVRPRVDLANSDDRRSFARRLLNRPGRAPDVLLLQEVLGSARAVARSLNNRPKALRGGARYRVAVAPRVRKGSGPCAGPRTGRYTTLRDSAILVNTKTVRKVHATGVVRTWGQWLPMDGRGKVIGCAEQPWARLTVQQPGMRARTALAVSVHLAPRAPWLKNSAMTRLQKVVDRMHAKAPRHLVVIGGDFNLNRCNQPLARAERPGCALRRGHRNLLDAGYRDAALSPNRTGRAGSAGVARRIDFVYTKGTVRSSWYDRCYRAYLVKRFPCERKRTVFGAAGRFGECQHRALFIGRHGGGCPSYDFRRYYSDHPIVLATLR